MTALLITILSASVLGSLHCAGMCGAFLAFAVGIDPADRRTRWPLHAAYHLGRLGTYTAFGAAAGAVGAVFDLAGRTVGLQRVAAIVSAVVILVFGLSMVARAMGLRVRGVRVPRRWAEFVGRIHQRIAGLPPIARATSVGLVTTLLPCGWLYAFVAVAAGTAHPGAGALAMAAFWVGTLPVMVALGFAVQRFTGVVGKRLPVIASAALVIVATATLVTRTARITETSGSEVVAAEPMAQLQALMDGHTPACHANP